MGKPSTLPLGSTNQGYTELEMKFWNQTSLDNVMLANSQACSLELISSVMKRGNAFLACFSNSLSNETYAHPSMYHSSQFPWNHCTIWRIVRIVKVNKILTKFVKVCGWWRRKTETRTVLFSTLFDSSCLDSLVHIWFWTNSGMCWWL